MARSGTHSLARGAAGLLLACIAAPALAICFPQLRRVGAVASDAACTDDTIQAAIDAVSDNPSCPAVIAITREHIWGNQHLSVADKSLDLVGFGDGVTCSQVGAQNLCGLLGDCPTGPLVTLNGSGGGRVLSITGASNVTLRYLTITGGDVAGIGGGIRYDGSGTLWLDTDTINFNHADAGGGIAFHGTASSAALRVLPYTLILANSADASGGGILISGSARLFAAGAQSWIALNEAAGYGGGIAILGPARADLGSPGLNGAALVASNQAHDGGGVAVVDVGAGEGVLRVYPSAVGQPTAISSNTADATGGALYLSGASSACLFAPRLRDNIAEDGAAIFENDYNGSGFVDGVGVFVNGGAPARLGADCGPETVASLGGAKDCAPDDADCSTISDNATQHADGSPSAGATVAARGAFVAGRLRMRGNVAHELVSTGSGDLDLERCLLTDNGVSGALLYGYSGLARVHSCTIANNVIDDAYVMQYFDGAVRLDLAYDIVDQPGRYTVNWLSGSGATFDVSYVLASRVDGLPQNNPSVVQGAPTFVDAAGGDYHLAPVAQPAIDFGQGANFDSFVDLDGAPAPVDLAAIPNRLPGSADLGAFERQSLFACGSSDTLFCNGFEP